MAGTFSISAPSFGGPLNMCDPITAIAVLSTATAAVGVASAVSQYQGQKEAYSDNKEAANLGYAANENVAAQKGMQISQEQSQNTLQAAIARAKAEGRVSASASSFGGTYTTAARDVAGVDFQVGQQLGVANINTQNQRLALADQETSNWYDRQNQINSVAKASPAQLGIGIASAALQGASTYKSLGGRF